MFKLRLEHKNKFKESIIAIKNSMCYNNGFLKFEGICDILDNNIKQFKSLNGETLYLFDKEVEIIEKEIIEKSEEINSFIKRTIGNMTSQRFPEIQDIISKEEILLTKYNSYLNIL